MRTCPKCLRSFPDDTDFCPRDGTALPRALAATEADLGAGLARRYRLLRRLGGGGMGTVFLAEQIAVGSRLVALKVLRRSLLDDPQFLLRFNNEAASTGRINHRNVVTVYESGQSDDGTPYIAMQYLEGESLRTVLKTRGALPAHETVEILQQVSRGLHAAHKLGIIHRDLKPDNILLTCVEDAGESVTALRGPDGLPYMVKLVDFGIAKLREAATHTLTGTVLGTPAYMSYEQASGMRSEELDARSDIYSLGIVAYEMLMGRVPFHSDTPLGYVYRHLSEQPPPFRAVKPDLAALPEVERVVMRALAKDRNQRHSSALEFARELAVAAEAAPAQEIKAVLGSTKITGSAEELLELARNSGRETGRVPDAPGIVQRLVAEASGLPRGDKAGFPREGRALPHLPVRYNAAGSATRAREGGALPYRPQSAPPNPRAMDGIEPTEPEPYFPAARQVATAPSLSSAVAQTPKAPVVGRSPKFAVEPERSGRARYVIAAGIVGLAAISVGVWYALPSATNQIVQVNQPQQTTAPPPSKPAETTGQAALAEMVAIPGGTFEMGRASAPDAEETPAHLVTVAPFYIDRTLVTNAQLRAHGLTFSGGILPSDQADWPGTRVSWNDAEAYCESKGARLPTEAEWEFAARGTDGRLYPWGSEFGSWATNSKEAGLGYPVAVGAYANAGSPFGVLDMSGNVWEWTADPYKPYPGSRPRFRIPADAKVIRGGSYQSDKDHVTTTTRNLDHASSRSPVIGFRCAKSQ